MKKLNPAKVILFFGLLLITPLSWAQLVVTANPTITQIVSNLAGAGATISNATLVCPTGASAIFSGGGSTNLGIGSGVILTTGSSTATAGAASSFASVDNLGAGNALLNSMAGGSGTFEECRLEFDIMPACGTLQMSYVFGSEEYPEFVGMGYNDAFGFFVSGPNPGGGTYTNQNIAVLPGTSTFVGIDNVNGSTNSAYYVDNSAGSTIAYDGLTTVLTASINVTPCASYHMILVIADGGDGIYDSGVFLTYQGLTCPSPVVSVGPPSTICAGQSATLTASGMTTYTWTPGGMTGASVTVTPTVSTVYTVTALQGACNTSTATVSVTVNNSPTVTVNSATVCPGGTATLTATGATTYSWAGGTTPTTGATVNASPGSTTVYTVTGTAAGCTATATSTVTVASALNVTVNSATICPGGTATLTAAGATTYSWAGGTTPTTGATVNASPGSTTVYTVTGTTGTCTGTVTATVTVGSSLNVTVNSPTICAGATTTLTATGAVNYSWTAGTSPGTGASVTATPGTTTQYTVTGTDANGCVGTAVSTVSVNALPVINVNSPQICIGSTATLTATGAANYLWSAGTTPNNAATVTASPAVTTSYTVTGTDVNGCVSTAVSTVTVGNSISIDAGPNDTICNGAAFNLSGSGALNYVWTPGTLPGANVSVSPTATTTYTLVGTDAAGCVGVDSVTISVAPTMTLSTGGFPESCNGSCDGQVVVLVNPTTGPFASYQYVWTGGAGTAASANGLCAATYSVTVTDVAGCTATASAQVTQPTAVTAVLTSSTNASCNGTCDGTALITPAGGAAGYTYTWSSVGAGNNPLNLCAGSYTCTVADANNCSVTVPVVITQPAPLTVSITPVNPLCLGQSATLNAVAAGGTSAYTYTWSAGTTPASGASVSASPASPTTYTVTVVDANSCPSAQATITVSVATALNVVASNNVSICLGQSANLSAVGSGGNNVYTYSWATGTVPGTGAAVSASPQATTTYTVTLTDGCGTPPATASVTVTVNPLPTLSITPSITSGCAPVCVDFTANSNPASASCNWLFNDGQTANGNCNPNICFSNAGTFGATLNVTDVNGCSNSFTNNSLVTVYPVPTAAFVFSPDPASELAPTVSFTDLSSGAIITVWDWTFGDTLNGTSSLQNPVYEYGAAGVYNVTLTVTTANGCTDVVTHPVTINPEFIIYVPNAFSPNADGVNDSFFPKGVGIDTDHYEMWIYDRWGNLIWSNTDFLKTWDGKVLGQSEIVQEDVYVWKIKLKTLEGEKKTYVGHVTVVK